MKVEAVERILEAAANGRGGERLTRAMINLHELACALETVESKFRTAHQLKSGARARERIRALSLIEKTAKRLKALLEGPENWQEITNSSLYPLELDDPRVVLSRLAKAANDLSKPKSPLFLLSEVDRRVGARVANVLGIGRKSAFRVLVSEDLPKVFRRHTCLKVTCRSGNSPDTPFVRFVAAFLVEAGIRTSKGPYAREAIVRAKSDRRERRRGGRAHGQTEQKKIKMPSMTSARRRIR